MKRRSILTLIAIVALISAGLVVRTHYFLDSQELDAAIKAELPSGTLKANVIQFIHARTPIACDDLGTHVKARITGRAGNLIYRKDIVLDFEFDANARLLSYTKKEYLTFL